MSIPNPFSLAALRRFLAIVPALLLVAMLIDSTSPVAYAQATDTEPQTADAINGIVPALAPPDVTAEAVYAFDMTSGTAMYGKNIFERRQIGSVVKIMTALVVVNNAKDLNAQVTIVDQDMVEEGYTNMALKPGDVLTVSQLLYGMLIPSGGDAAKALARYVGSQLGGTKDPQIAYETFITEMNRYATELGLKNSRFVNADGADSDNAYSCAYDVGVLSELLMGNETLASIVKEPAYQLTSPGGKTYAQDSSNKFLLGGSGYTDPSVVGIKTGTEQAAGGNISIARKVNSGANTVIIVILGSRHVFNGEVDPTTGQPNAGADIDERYADGQAIFAAMDAQFTWATPDAVDALGGLNQEMAIWGVAWKSPPAIPIPNVDGASLGYQLVLGEPADAGKRVGSVYLYYGDTRVGALPVYQASALRSAPFIADLAAA